MVNALEHAADAYIFSDSRSMRSGPVTQRRKCTPHFLPVAVIGESVLSRLQRTPYGWKREPLLGKSWGGEAGQRAGHRLGAAPPNCHV
ncbi:hypothetical protein BDW74DRAFT_148890 [Aspergillus multicolor]|uniref:uncharacterized protein n=1 Tax=Aspergillus multicolor TaxID=41759 RepID=UPI003CCDCA1E